MPLSDAYTYMQQQCACVVLKFFEYLYFRNKNNSSFVIKGNLALQEFQYYLKDTLRFKDDVVSKLNFTTFVKKLRDYMNDYPNSISKKERHGKQTGKHYVFYTSELQHMLQKNGLLTEDSYMFLDT